MKIAFLGLGVMGYPMAGHLANEGHNMHVYNRTKRKAEKWIQQYPGNLADTPEEAVRDAEIVFSCVGNDNDLKEITMGRYGAFHGMKVDAIYVDHSTTSAKIARFLFDEASKVDINFLDAPVSGGEQGAIDGKLTIMVGGSLPCFKVIDPILQTYSCQTLHMGEVGAGQLTKNG